LPTSGGASPKISNKIKASEAAVLMDSLISNQTIREKAEEDEVAQNLIRAGRHLRNGNQQFYEGLLR
jgi:hypothetical protein